MQGFIYIMTQMIPPKSTGKDRAVQQLNGFAHFFGRTQQNFAANLPVLQLYQLSQQFLSSRSIRHRAKGIQTEHKSLFFPAQLPGNPVSERGIFLFSHSAAPAAPVKGLFRRTKQLFQ